MAADLPDETWRSYPGAGYSPGQARARRFPTALFILCAAGLGAALRLMPVLRSGFPVGDGGLFFSMVKDLQANHYALPAYTSYNLDHIPLAYPPLGFYVAGLLNQLTGLSLVQVFQFLPPVATALTVLAFALLGRALLESDVAVVAATFAFALLPDAFYTERMGGGITRSLGLLFALLTLQQLALLYRRDDKRHIVSAALFAALTAASHLEWLLFAAYSGAILFVAFGRTRATFIQSTLVVAGALALSAPWWLAVVLHHGIAPFTATLSNSSSVFPWYAGIAALFSLRLTHELPFPVITALALGGLLVCIRARRWFLPVWLLATFTVEARAYLLRPVIVVALLAGIGVEAVLLPLLQRGRLGSTSRVADVFPRAPWRLAPIVLGFLIAYALLSANIWDEQNTTVLSKADRSAMGWVNSHTTRTSAFFVVTRSDWGFTNPAEWFPALAHRESVVTVPGYEWVPGALAQRQQRWDEALDCASRDVACVERWIRATGIAVSYLYISRGPDGTGLGHLCCRRLRESAVHDPRYVRVYDRRGVEIFRRLAS